MVYTDALPKGAELVEGSLKAKFPKLAVGSSARHNYTIRFTDGQGFNAPVFLPAASVAYVSDSEVTLQVGWELAHARMQARAARAAPMHGTHPRQLLLLLLLIKALPCRPSPADRPVLQAGRVRAVAHPAAPEVAPHCGECCTQLNAAALPLLPVQWALIGPTARPMHSPCTRAPHTTTRRASTPRSASCAPPMTGGS